MTTVADEKVMELAASSVMPNVPSPISNEMDQSPKGLLGMASNDVVEMQTGGITTGGLTASRKSISESLGLDDVDLKDPAAAALLLASLDPRRAGLRILGSKAKPLLGSVKGLLGRVGDRFRKRFGKDDIEVPTGMPTGKIKVDGQTYDPSRVLVPQKGVDIKKVVTDPYVRVPIGASAATAILTSGDGEDTGIVDTGDIGDTGGTGGTGGIGGTGGNTQTKTGLQQGMSGDDLAKFGFAILASKSPSELGKNLYNLVDERQKRKGTGLEGAQQAFYEARTEELRANIANMPEDNLRRSLDSVNDSIKLIQEGVGDESELTELQMIRLALVQQLAELKGLDMSSSPLAGGASIN
jgi:hypothetical protein